MKIFTSAIKWFRERESNKDLRDQINAQNEKIDNLENKIKDHEERIEKRKDLLF